MNAQKNQISLMNSLHNEAIWLVFIDGKLNTENLAIPEGLKIDHLKGALEIQVSEGTIINQPIVIHYISTVEESTNHFFNTVIRVGKKAEITFVQYFQSEAELSYEQKSLIEIHCAEQSTLHLLKVQQEGLKATHLGEYSIHQAEDSVVYSSHYSLGALIHQEKWQVNLSGQSARCHCRGLAIANNTQRLDSQLTLNHLARACTSEQVFKSIATDKARTGFTGKVVVPSSGQQAAAHQLSQNLLLSAQAEINTRPELEIYADDVKCTHGASVGQLDPDALFYLQSRGIDQVQASEMLLNAFIQDQLSEAEPWIQQWVGPLIEQKLAQINESSNL